MATLAELNELFSGGDINPLRDKVRVAAYIAANAIMEEDPGTPARRSWAADFLQNPAPISEALLRLIVAANSGVAIGAITGAADNTIITAVNMMIDKLNDLV